MAKKKESYIKSSYDELINKVSWPTWSQLQNSTIVVAIASIIIALMIFLMDYIMGTNSSEAYWRGFLGYFYSLFS